MPAIEYPGEYYVNNFVGGDPRLFAGVWSADSQETLIESYPVDEVCPSPGPTPPTCARST
jgi:hypothetical protein